MDWFQILQITANVAQIIGVLLVLVPSGYTIISSARDFFKKRQPIRKPNASIVRNILLGLLILVIVSFRSLPILNSKLPTTSTTPTPGTTKVITPSPTASTSALTSTATLGGTPLVGVDMDLFHHLIEQNGVPNGVSDSTSYIRDLHQGEIAYTSGESFDANLEFQTVMNLNGTNTKVSEPSSANDRNGTTTIVYIFIGAGHIAVTNFTTQNWGNGYGLIRQGVNPLAQALVLAENIQQHFSLPGSGAQGNPSKHVYYAIIDAGSKKILATTIPNLTQFVA